MTFRCLEINPAYPLRIPTRRVGKTMRSFQDDSGGSASTTLGLSEAMIVMKSVKFAIYSEPPPCPSNTPPLPPPLFSSLYA
ncbi:hypothetical protein ACFX12_045713 [Malus domestica]